MSVAWCKRCLCATAHPSSLSASGLCDWCAIALASPIAQPSPCPDCAKMRAERDEARKWRMPDTSTEAFEAAFLEFEKEDRSWMTREDLAGHYTCAIANWNICLDERDALQARLAAAERVVDAARARRDVWTRDTLAALDDAIRAYDAAKGGT